MTADADPLAAAVHGLLLARAATVATAESLTGGLLAHRLSATPGSSATLRGGIVAYATELKAALLGVPADLLAEVGPVHPAVARAMAEGVRRRLGASYGVALTGVAGPEPQGGRPPGVCLVAVAAPGGTAVQELRLTGDRAEVRRRAAAAGLEALRRTLVAEAPQP